ncbi:Ndufb8, NADH dehydrogenase 19kDa subunit [Gyrodon lividus]|nr:Ndufb8, NADH dehydrogenase 19kDa subunit [Gyrodon lividus]
MRLTKGAFSVIARRQALVSTTKSLRWSRTASTSATQEKDPQLGDYPDLPWLSNQTLQPRGWWDQQMRRNFGDPVHENEEVLSMWGPDISAVLPHTALFQFTLAASAFVGFAFLCKYALLPERPTVAREYPFSGLVLELGGLEENKAREETDDGDE